MGLWDFFIWAHWAIFCFKLQSMHLKWARWQAVDHNQSRNQDIQWWLIWTSQTCLQQNNLPVIHMLTQWHLGIGDAKSPDLTNEALKGIAIVHWRTFIWIFLQGGRNPSVRRAGWVHSMRCICAVYTDATFAFANHPLEWIQHQAFNEEDKRTRQVQVECLLLLCSKLPHDGWNILYHHRVVVVLVASAHFWLRAEVSSLERNSVNTGTFAARKAHGGQTGRRWANANALQGGISVIPIVMMIGVLTTEPADEIAIDKVESQQSRCIKKTTGGTESNCQPWWNDWDRWQREWRSHAVRKCWTHESTCRKDGSGAWCSMWPGHLRWSSKDRAGLWKKEDRTSSLTERNPSLLLTTLGVK